MMVTGFNPERIISRREISVCGRAVSPVGLYPVFVVPVQFVPVKDFFRGSNVQRRKLKIKVVVLMIYSQVIRHTDVNNYKKTVFILPRFTHDGGFIVHLQLCQNGYYLFSINRKCGGIKQRNPVLV